MPVEARDEVVRPAGLEPATCGLGNRKNATVRASQTSTYNDTDSVLGACLATLQQHIPDLASVVEGWENLPEPVRAGIPAVISAVSWTCRRWAWWSASSSCWQGEAWDERQDSNPRHPASLVACVAGRQCGGSLISMWSRRHSFEAHPPAEQGTPGKDCASPRSVRTQSRPRDRRSGSVRS